MLACLIDNSPELISRELIERMITQKDMAAIEIARGLDAFHDVACKLAENYVAQSQFKAVQRLIDDGILPQDYRVPIEPLAAAGDLKTIQALERNGLATATTDAMDQAAEANKWQVVMYLHETRSEGCTTRAMDAAADQGDLENVKFLHEHRSEGCTSDAMDGAASLGSLPVVRFLHNNRKEGCTTRAIDGAAENGCLHIVKFLHANRSEGCTTEAMDLAAANGHWNVVQFLHSDRNEGCTKAAVENAIKNGHVTVMRYLHEHYRSFFGAHLMYDLLLRGMFDIWMELRVLYRDEVSAAVESVMFEAGKQFELATIHFVINELGRDDLAHRAVDGAALATDGKSILWPRAVIAVAGPESCRLSAIRNAVVATGMYNEPAALLYLITVCSEDGAASFALAEARSHRDDYHVEPILEKWISSGQPANHPPVHPLLRDCRCSSWLIRRICTGEDSGLRFHGARKESWVIEAVYRDDRTMLEILWGSHSKCEDITFYGCQAAAARTGNLPMLQWLLSTLALSMEKTLLYEALYYHQFEVAEWLVENCVSGCRDCDWSSKKYVGWRYSCDLDDGVLLGYLETHALVQQFVDYGEIARHAARWGDMVALERIHKTRPEVFTTRRDLASVAKTYGHGDVLAFLA